MTSLADKVARVKELQANCYPDGIKDAQALGYAIFMFKQEADNMAALISQLWDELEHLKALKMTADAVMEYEVIKKQREVLVMAREKIAQLEGAFTYIEQYLGYCRGQEIGLHRAGDVNPYYVSWNDGEFWIGTSWAHAKKARDFAKDTLTAIDNMMKVGG